MRLLRQCNTPGKIDIQKMYFSFESCNGRSYGANFGVVRAPESVAVASPIRFTSRSLSSWAPRRARASSVGMADAQLKEGTA